MTEILLANCRVLDPPTRQVIEADVLVRDGHIAAVETAGSVTASEGVVRNMGGAYLMPGLINMHVHFGLKLPGRDAQRLAAETPAALALRMAANARAALQAGVTTVRLLGEEARVDLALRAAIERRETDGPRIFTAVSAITTTGGHGHGSGAVEADGVAGFRQAVRSQIKVGADLIKLMASGGIAGEFEGASGLQPAPDELEAAIGVAHSWAKKVTAHAGPPQAIEEAVGAGIDCIEHGYGITREVAEKMKAAGTWLVPTLSVTRCREFFERIEAPPWMIERALAGGPGHMEAFQHAHQAGVRIALGTDMIPAEPYERTTATIRELEHMTEAGMSAWEVLEAATSSPAEWLGADERLGRVEEGKAADLIACRENPSEDVSALRGISFVMKAGVVYRQEGG